MNRVLKDLVILLFQVEGDTLTNGDFPYKCKCFLQKANSYLVFRVLPISFYIYQKITSLKQLIC